MIWPCIVLHRNLLVHYRNQTFQKCVLIRVDGLEVRLKFSENIHGHVMENADVWMDDTFEDAVIFTDVLPHLF